MGIKSLNKFLRDTCPDVYEEIHISEYAYKKVAIDISLYLYVFKAAYQERWLRSFIQLVECLRQHELHCVFIYDSGAPPEKDAERKERADSRAKHEQRTYKLEEAIERFHETGEVDPLLVEFQTKRKIKPKRLLRPDTHAIDIKSIEFYVNKMKRQIFDVTPADFALTKKLFDILDVPYFQAPLEAETCCADLCKRGIVDAVLSRDSDVIAYAAPIFLTNLNTDTGVCHRLHYDTILEELDFTSDQFLDFCIMCGTDYNKNIFRVGPKTAYNKILNYGSIEGIEENTKLDTSILKYKRGRELFRGYEQADIKVPYCGAPNFEQLTVFITKHNINIPVESLRKAFVHNTVVFEDTDEEAASSDEEFILEIDSDDEDVVEFQAPH
jgi:5'-3' exonuclease